MTDTIAFDMILPMMSEESIGCWIRRTTDRGAIHFKFSESIKLSKFGVFPVSPIRERLEFAASEVSESLFLRSSGGRLDGVDGGRRGRMQVLENGGRVNASIVEVREREVILERRNAT